MLSGLRRTTVRVPLQHYLCVIYVFNNVRGGSLIGSAPPSLLTFDLARGLLRCYLETLVMASFLLSFYRNYPYLLRIFCDDVEETYLSYSILLIIAYRILMSYIVTLSICRDIDFLVPVLRPHFLIPHF
jgi:hypothetical protein